MVKSQKKMECVNNSTDNMKKISTMTDNQQQQGSKTKEKRRNNEKRKEKSRDAARCRRSRETEIFTELAQSLPLKKDEVDQLDKASIMRLSISFLKIREMVELFSNINALIKEVDDVKEEKHIRFPKDLEKEKFVLQALDGFVLVLSVDGDVTYASENIHEFLGINQIDLLGQPIWEYSHQCDHEELREALNGRRASPSEIQSGKLKNDVQPNIHRDFFLRLKCTLTSRGRSVNIKSASYKVIHVSGHVLTNAKGQNQLISVCRPLPHPSNIDVPMGSSTFLTKHSLDMKFSYVDDKMFALLGYQPQHLIGKSLYECHHGGDSDSLLSTFKSLISKGQTETCRYRFLARTGGYSWIVTQATLVYDKQKPQSVVCVNYVISGIENENEIYSCSQLEASEEKRINKRNIIAVKEEEIVGVVVEKSIDSKKLSSAVYESTPILNLHKSLTKSKITSIIKSNSTVNNSRPRSVTATIFNSSSDIPTVVVTPPTSTKNSTLQRGLSITSKVFTPIAFVAPTIRPQPVTSKLFVPRTEDMSKGFLMFSEEEPGLTMLKDEPDDLTHLAPTAGDACIPLDEATPYFSDMFDDLILPDNYCTLLPDDINSLDSHSSKANSTDPFINYRDESSDTSGTPNILSPGLSKSPAGSSLPSLCSPNGSLPEEDLSFMGMNMDDELDLSMRAPYIPMSEADDLPLLLSDDLMWGAFPEGLSLHKEIKTVNNNANNSSSNNCNNNNTNINNNNNNNSNNNTNENIKLNEKISIDSSLAALLCSDGNNSTQQNQSTHNQQQQQNHHHILQPTQQHQNQVQNNSNKSVNNTNANTINNHSNDTHNNRNRLSNNNNSTISPSENNNNNNNIEQKNEENLVNPNDVLGQVFNKNCSNIVDQAWTMTDLLQINTSNSVKNINNSNNINATNNVSILTTPIIIQTSHLTNSNSNINKKQDRIQNNHKRPSNITSLDTNNTKRIKSSSVQLNSENQSSPQLLQQLMAPTPSPQRSRSKLNSNSHDKLDGKWNLDSGGQKSLINLQHQASNSVLMNLLVSGCDELRVETPEVFPDKSTDELTSPSERELQTVINQNIMLSTGIVSPLTISNPMIGGTNHLLVKTIENRQNNISPNILFNDNSKDSESTITTTKNIIRDQNSPFLDSDTLPPLLYDLEIMMQGHDLLRDLV